MGPWSKVTAKRLWIKKASWFLWIECEGCGSKIGTFTPSHLQAQLIVFWDDLIFLKLIWIQSQRSERKWYGPLQNLTDLRIENSVIQKLQGCFTHVICYLTLPRTYTTETPIFLHHRFLVMCLQVIMHCKQHFFIKRSVTLSRCCNPPRTYRKILNGISLCSDG